MVDHLDAGTAFVQSLVNGLLYVGIHATTHYHQLVFRLQEALDQIFLVFQQAVGLVPLAVQQFTHVFQHVFAAAYHHNGGLGFYRSVHGQQFSPFQSKTGVKKGKLQVPICNVRAFFVNDLTRFVSVSPPGRMAPFVQ